MSILPVGEESVAGKPGVIPAIRRVLIFFDAYPVPSNVLGSLPTVSYIFFPIIPQSRFL